jgi:hypothetical protein
LYPGFKKSCRTLAGTGLQHFLTKDKMSKKNFVASKNLLYLLQFKNTNTYYEQSRINRKDC